MVIKIIFEILLVPNKRIFQSQVNYIIMWKIAITSSRVALASSFVM